MPQPLQHPECAQLAPSRDFSALVEAVPLRPVPRKLDGAAAAPQISARTNETRAMVSRSEVCAAKDAYRTKTNLASWRCSAYRVLHAGLFKIPRPPVQTTSAEARHIPSKHHRVFLDVGFGLSRSQPFQKLTGFGGVVLDVRLCLPFNCGFEPPRGSTWLPLVGSSHECIRLSKGPPASSAPAEAVLPDGGWTHPQCHHLQPFGMTKMLLQVLEPYA